MAGIAIPDHIISLRKRQFVQATDWGGTITVQDVTRDDIEPLSRLLAEVFQEDPFHSWIFPNVSIRMRRQRRFFALSLRRRMGLDVMYTTPDHRGVCAWSGPNTPRSNILHALWFKLLFGLNIGPRAPLLLPGVRRLISHQPKYPHWYLSLLATHPEHRRQGLGTTLLQPILSQCDTEGIPAYLEATSEISVAFYKHIGFVVVQEIKLPFGPTLWPMLRKPD